MRDLKAVSVRELALDRASGGGSTHFQVYGVAVERVDGNARIWEEPPNPHWGHPAWDARIFSSQH